ncbi:MAG TPA: universal stress protein [Acidimicrobiales bacterium]|jgi:nucleotide-binding universal stress UspA family protein|nr:universal stress protein [Acidimicrobiales bacterium]
MRRIVVGVDESDGAAAALRWALREGDLHGATVVAVLAWGLLDQHRAGGDAEFDPDYGADDADEALRAIVAGAAGDDAAATIELQAVCDVPAKALLAAAEGADLLVSGARGLGGFRGLLLGSVSQHLLHHSKVPIAIVRPPRNVGGESERIVVGVDGSDRSKAALAWAVAEASVRDAVLVAAHAWRVPVVGEYPFSALPIDPANYAATSEALLDEVLGSADVGALAGKVERASVQGSAAGALLELAESADLLVIGSRGLGGFKGMLLGSVANQVARHAPCTVVVLPARD